MVKIISFNTVFGTFPMCDYVLDLDINTDVNIKTFSLKNNLYICDNCGFGMQSQYKQKQGEASTLVESMKLGDY